MTSHAVEARSLSKSYGDVQALDEVDLSVDEGEVFGLVGPNGAGKTTLVRCLTGTTSPSNGEVRVLDEAPSSLDRARLGLLPQEFTPSDRLTSRELVEYYRGLYPVERVRDVDAVLEEVGLSESTDRRYRELSGGQKRRLLVAASIVNDPDVLFLDEPTTGIDPAGRREVWRVVRELSAEGTTVFLTTHYMDEASELCDRVGLLHRGELAETGSPEELVRRHGGDPRLELRTPDLEAVDEALSRFDVRREGAEAAVDDVSIEDVSSVLRALEEADVEVEEMNWRTPELEDVYLELAGEFEDGEVEP